MRTKPNLQSGLGSVSGQCYNLLPYKLAIGGNHE